MLKCDVVWIGGVRICRRHRLIQQRGAADRLNPHLDIAGLPSKNPVIEVDRIGLTGHRRYRLREYAAISERCRMAGSG